MLVRDISEALQHSEQKGYPFDPMSLSKSALVRLCRQLDHSKEWNILELGGGQSTLFWSALDELNLLKLTVTTLEHDSGWTADLRGRVRSDRVHVSAQQLKQINDEEWERIFADPDGALERWQQSGAAVPKEQYKNYTIHNAFYCDLHQAGLAAQSVDVLIVDGPHGNGRGLAFPLLATVLKPDAWVLIDDFDHYPFLECLERVFRHEELIREIAGRKRWLLTQLRDRR